MLLDDAVEHARRAWARHRGSAPRRVLSLIVRKVASKALTASGRTADAVPQQRQDGETGSDGDVSHDVGGGEALEVSSSPFIAKALICLNGF